MLIKKKLNNNVAVVLDDFGHELIVMGKGLAFDRKAGEPVDESIIEKRFVLSSEELSIKMQEILVQIPMKYVKVSTVVIEEAKRELGTELNENIYISLTDHIYMAVKRYLEGLFVPNPMLWDIKRLYKKEYQIGMKALEVIQRELKVELPEDEAGFIAFHLVNAKENFDYTVMLDVMKLVKEIMNIVKYHLSLDFDEESLYYYRFLTHLKFFAQRLFDEKGQLAGERDSLFQAVKTQYKKAYSCTQMIAKFLKNKYQYDVTEEEQLYLMIHIENIIEKCKLDCDD